MTHYLAPNYCKVSVTEVLSSTWAHLYQRIAYTFTASLRASFPVHQPQCKFCKLVTCSLSTLKQANRCAYVFWNTCPFQKTICEQTKPFRVFHGSCELKPLVCFYHITWHICAFPELLSYIETSPSKSEPSSTKT